MRRISRLLVASALALASGAFPSAGCGGATGPAVDADTAAERARREHEASGEERVSGEGKQWGGWRYAGSRDECFYLVGRTCFKDEKKACKAARCGKAKCVVEGGGPATVRCAK